MHRKLRAAKNTMNAIRGWKLATSKIELSSFFGFCNVSRRFVQSLSNMASTLNAKLEREKPKLVEMDNTVVAVLNKRKKKIDDMVTFSSPRAREHIHLRQWCIRWTNGQCLTARNQRPTSRLIGYGPPLKLGETTMRHHSQKNFERRTGTTFIAGLY